MNDDNSTPLTVSVVMCTYNGEQFLREQMDSILAQNYPLHEIIVQDDRSTDDTWDILQSYAKAHPGLFKLFRNDEQLGFNRNFHTALLRATGQYVAISDQDDIWFPQKIRRQVEAIGEADLCYSDYYRDAHYTLPLHDHISPPCDMVSLTFCNTIPGHSMLIRRSFMLREEAWNDAFYYDWWFLITAHLQGNGVAHVAEPLNWHRPHAASAIAQIRHKQGWRHTVHPTWQPYLLGWFDLSRMRKQKAWKAFYLHLESHTSKAHFPLVHQLSKALLHSWRTPQLCLLCVTHRNEVYPSCRGWKQILRALFRPAIYAYGNTAFSIRF